ncbi:MAG: hypothetical protein ABFS14_13230 [Gemmatimonadota bacterium]
MTMEQRVADLERSYRRVQVVAAVLTFILAIIALRPFIAGSDERVIRAQGIVLIDDQGRERILIGAPIPHAENRIRTDSARARQEWASRFPDADKYMGFYADYDHSMNGVLVLDEWGFDRLALGDPTPDPNVGRRLGPASGLQINDAKGFERSGYGLLSVDGVDRVVLGLDSNRGTEALTLAVLDGGRVGLSIGGDGETIFLGRAAGGDFVSGLDSAHTGLVIRRGDTVLYSAGSGARPR